jgi:hypothetical protein
LRIIGFNRVRHLTTAFTRTESEWLNSQVSYSYYTLIRFDLFGSDFSRRIKPSVTAGHALGVYPAGRDQEIRTGASVTQLASQVLKEAREQLPCIK